MLDFDAAEAFAPATASLAINNLGGDFPVITSVFRTAGVTAGLLETQTVFGGGPYAFKGIPDARTQNGDLHVLTVTAASLIDFTVARFVTSLFRNLSAKTVTLGPAMGNVTVSALTTTPYARLRAVYTIQAELDDFFVFAGGQASPARAGPAAGSRAGRDTRPARRRRRGVTRQRR